MSVAKVIEQDVKVEIGEVLAAVRKDKTLKLILTHLSIAAWLVDVFFPWLPHGAAHLGMLTNLLWIWS